MRPLLAFLVSIVLAAPAAAQPSDVALQVDALPWEVIRVADFDPTNLRDAPVFITVTVFNDDQPRDLSFEVIVSGGGYGRLGTARGALGTLPGGGVRTFTNRDYETYAVSGGARRIYDAVDGGLLPAGSYTFEIRILEAGTRRRLAEESVVIETTNPDTEFELIGPGTRFGSPPEELAGGYPFFEWFSDAAAFDLAVYDVPPGTTSEAEAVQGEPVFATRGRALTDTFFPYPASAARLLPGRTYAWQVTAYVLTSGGLMRYPSPVSWFVVPDEAAAQNVFGAGTSTNARSGARLGAAGETDAPVVRRRRGADRIEVAPDETTVAPGEEVRFSATVYDVDGDPLAVDVAWRTLPAGRGEIEPDGRFVAGDALGPVAVVASVRDVEGFATVTIEPASAPPVARGDSSAAGRSGPGGAQADEEPAVALLYPFEDGVLQEPAPTFVWVATGIDSAATRRYRLRVWVAPPGYGGGVPVEAPLWSRTVTGFALPYPADAPALQSGFAYLADVALVDGAGAVVVGAPPLRFLLLPSPKLDHALYQQWDAVRRQGLDDQSVELLAEVRSTPLDAANRQRLLDAGAVILIEEGPWVQLSIPYTGLGGLAALEFLQAVSLPAPHRLSARLTPLPAGEDAQPEDTRDENAEPRAEPRAAPRAGVFEFGFDVAAIRAALPGRTIRTHSFRSDGTMEGAAPAEAMHGLATVVALAERLPTDAELHLYTFNTEPEFLQALRHAVREENLQTLSCSVSWSDAYDDYDGTSYLSRTVDAVLGDDAVLVAAAGNFAQSHWEGPYRDAGGAHDFGDGDLRLRLQSGTYYDLLLSWDDWDGLEADLDLHVLDAFGERIYTSGGQPVGSENRQRTGQYERPVERVYGFLPPYPGTQTYRVRIVGDRIPASDPPHYELYVYPPPAGASPAPLAESSLASGLATTRTVRPIAATAFGYGSHGPTNDGRPRPYFAADGAVRLGDIVLEGTSFATPRAAAAFALVFATHPDWSATEAVDYLRGFAAGGAGAPANDVGWGTLDMDALRTALTP